MSGPQDTAALLQQLENDHATGCLTITSSDGLVTHVYLLYGQIFHAGGPNTAGETALQDTLSWSDVGLSFDPKAQLPTTQTIDLKKTGSAVWAHAARHGSSGPVLEVHILKRPPTTSDVGIPPLSADRRLMALTCAPMAGGCLAALVPLGLIGIGVLVNPNDIDGWLIATGMSAGKRGLDQWAPHPRAPAIEGNRGMTFGGPGRIRSNNRSTDSPLSPQRPLGRFPGADC